MLTHTQRQWIALAPTVALERRHTAALDLAVTATCEELEAIAQELEFRAAEDAREQTEADHV